jgi:rubredoxin
VSPAPRSESQLVTQVLTWLRGLDESHAHKIHGSRYSDAGEPDIDACIRGRAVKIELKMPGNKPTPVQMASMRRWEAAGAYVFWSTSLEDVQRNISMMGTTARANPQLCKHPPMDDWTRVDGSRYCRRCGGTTARANPQLCKHPPMDDWTRVDGSRYCRRCGEEML